jgi:hypothetical protein
MLFRSTTLLTTAVIMAATGFVAVPFAYSADPPSANQGTADTKRGEHSLDRAIAMASRSLDNVNQNIKGYRCKFIKAERIDGKVGPYSYMEMRVRHKPFSVYLNFVKPDKHVGRQAAYVEGKNKNKLSAKEAGLFGFGLLPTVHLAPLSPLAMRGQKYPITEAGIKNLTIRLLEVARHDRRHAETEVNYYQNAKVGGRVCTVIEVVHPKQRDTFLFHKAQVFVDRELNVPIRYAAYGWPAEPGAEAPLEEEYTYLDFKVDNELKDADFEIQ